MFLLLMLILYYCKPIWICALILWDSKANCIFFLFFSHLDIVFFPASLCTNWQASKGILSCVMPEVKDLYYLLELEFLPLDLASKVQPLLSKISKIGGKLSSASSLPEVQLSQYVSALEKLAALRLLKQVNVFVSTSNWLASPSIAYSLSLR